MKKVVLLLFSLLLFSCGASAPKATEKNALYEVLSEQADGGATIRFFEILSTEKEIAMLLNDEQLKNKIKPSDIQTSNFIVVNLGEKTSAGTKIQIENVVETDKNIVITIKETETQSASTVVQEITTPFSVVKINSKKEIIIK